MEEPGIRRKLSPPYFIDQLEKDKCRSFRVRNPPNRRLHTDARQDPLAIGPLNSGMDAGSKSLADLVSSQFSTDGHEHLGDAFSRQTIVSRSEPGFTFHPNLNVVANWVVGRDLRYKNDHVSL